MHLFILVNYTTDCFNYHCDLRHYFLRDNLLIVLDKFDNKCLVKYNHIDIIHLHSIQACTLTMNCMSKKKKGKEKQQKKEK
ncbi:hypothetical protein V1478_011116 [Vespula squamosa]|uniref:Uncharacterized protein n=1 Tax=Vespula squamosa TaxID=30214 RepID=A0ABD2AGE3_VESSQ